MYIDFHSIPRLISKSVQLLSIPIIATSDWVSASDSHLLTNWYSSCHACLCLELGKYLWLKVNHVMQFKTLSTFQLVFLKLIIEEPELYS